MSLVIMFVVATVNAPSWRRTMLIGVTVVLIAGLTGSRMSSAVLMVLLRSRARSRMLAVRGPDRELHAGAGLLMLALILFALTDNPIATPRIS
jgi:hypothetical protein